MWSEDNSADNTNKLGSWLLSCISLEFRDSLITAAHFDHDSFRRRYMEEVASKVTQAATYARQLVQRSDESPFYASTGSMKKTAKKKKIRLDNGSTTDDDSDSGMQRGRLGGSRSISPGKSRDQLPYLDNHMSAADRSEFRRGAKKFMKKRLVDESRSPSPSKLAMIRFEEEDPATTASFPPVAKAFLKKDITYLKSEIGHALNRFQSELEAMKEDIQITRLTSDAAFTRAVSTSQDVSILASQTSGMSIGGGELGGSGLSKNPVTSLSQSMNFTPSHSMTLTPPPAQFGLMSLGGSISNGEFNKRGPVSMSAEVDSLRNELALAVAKVSNLETLLEVQRKTGETIEQRAMEELARARANKDMEVEQAVLKVKSDLMAEMERKMADQERTLLVRLKKQSSSALLSEPGTLGRQSTSSSLLGGGKAPTKPSDSRDESRGVGRPANPFLKDPSLISVKMVSNNIRLRIRPKPSTIEPEIGFAESGDVFTVYAEPVSGFYRLADDKGFVVKDVPGVTWEVVAATEGESQSRDAMKTFNTTASAIALATFTSTSTADLSAVPTLRSDVSGVTLASSSLAIAPKTNSTTKLPGTLTPATSAASAIFSALTGGPNKVVSPPSSTPTAPAVVRPTPVSPKARVPLTKALSTQGIGAATSSSSLNTQIAAPLTSEASSIAAKPSAASAVAPALAPAAILAAIPAAKPAAIPVVIPAAKPAAIPAAGGGLPTPSATATSESSTTAAASRLVSAQTAAATNSASVPIPVPVPAPAPVPSPAIPTILAPTGSVTSLTGSPSASKGLAVPEPGSWKALRANPSNSSLSKSASKTDSTAALPAAGTGGGGKSSTPVPANTVASTQALVPPSIGAPAKAGIEREKSGEKISKEPSKGNGVLAPTSVSSSAATLPTREGAPPTKAASTASKKDLIDSKGAEKTKKSKGKDANIAGKIEDSERHKALRAKIQQAVQNCIRRKRSKTVSGPLLFRCAALVKMCAEAVDPKVITLGLSSAVEVNSVNGPLALQLATTAFTRLDALVSAADKASQFIEVDIATFTTALKLFYTTLEVAMSAFDVLSTLLKIEGARKESDVSATMGLQNTLDRMHDHGTCELLVTVLDCHAKHGQTAYKASRSLFRATLNSPRNAARIGEAPYVKVIAKTFKGYVKNALVVENMMRIISNLCSDNTANQDNLGEAGFCEIILMAFQEHRKSDRVVCLLAKGVISLCAQNHLKNQEFFGSSAKLDALVKILSKSKDKPQVVEGICWAFLSILVGNRKAVINLTEIGILEVLFEMISTAGNTADVVMYGCWVLSNLAYACTDDREITPKLKAILAKLEVNGANEEVKRHANIALSRINRPLSQRTTPGDGRGRAAISTTVKLLNPVIEEASPSGPV